MLACEEIMKKLVALAGAMALCAPAFANGIDSRAYTCADLHALVATNGFVFIGNPEFQDFVVANEAACGGGEYIQLRSVQTSDIPACPVNYCVPAHRFTGLR